MVDNGKGDANTHGSGRDDTGHDELVRYVDDYPPLVSMPFGLPDQCEFIRRRAMAGTSSPPGETRHGQHPYSYSGTQLHVNINVPPGDAPPSRAPPHCPPHNEVAMDHDRGGTFSRGGWLGGCRWQAFSVIAVVFVLWFATWPHRLPPGNHIRPLPISSGPFDEELSQLARLTTQYAVDIEATRKMAISAPVRHTFESLLPPSNALAGVIAKLREVDGAWAGVSEQMFSGRYSMVSVHQLRGEIQRARRSWTISWGGRAEHQLAGLVRGRYTQIAAWDDALLAYRQELRLVSAQLDSACDAVMQTEGGQLVVHRFSDACAPGGETVKLAKGTLSTGLAVCSNLDSVLEGIGVELAEGLERARELRNAWGDLGGLVGVELY